MSILNSVKEMLSDATIDDLHEVIRHCMEVIDRRPDGTIDDVQKVIGHCMEMIDRHYDAEVEEIDQKMAEMKAEYDREMAELRSRRNVIRPPESKPIVFPKATRNYREIVNPNNPSQVYKTGPRPDWLEDLLREHLGDGYGNKVEEASLMSLWRNGGVQ